MELGGIAFLNGATNIEAVEKGFSGAFKYSFYKNDKKYFLKIGKFSVNEELEIILNKAKINHTKIIEFKKYNEEFNYIIEEYIEGQTIKEKLNEKYEKFIYEYGFEIGKEYANLRKIFPDKPLDDKAKNDHKKKIDEEIENLKEILKQNNKLSKEITDFCKFAMNYLNENFQMFENSTMVFGHTDVKPSNFILYKTIVYASDIEHTDYKELSLALIWSYARDDFNDEKNLAFARGYLDGLYNLNVPQNILAAINYNYMYSMIHQCNKYIRKENYHKLEMLARKANENYIKDGKVIISEKLNSNLNNIEEVKNFDISLVSGSYDPYNLTFKCNNDYFLKVMKMNENKFKKIMESYKLMEDLKIPISPVKKYGKISDSCYYVLFKYYDWPNLGDEANKTFENGVKYGEQIAYILSKLKGNKVNGAYKYGKSELYEEIIKHIEEVYSNSNWDKYLSWKKDEVLEYVDKLIIYFDDNDIDLIHGDIKFDNILESNNEIIIVDNESLMYSFDIINFKYNIQNGFYKNSQFYQGFVNGYLKATGNGIILDKIQNQAKLLLLFYVIRLVRDILINTSSSHKLSYYIEICNEYIWKDKVILWLK